MADEKTVEELNKDITSVDASAENADFDTALAANLDVLYESGFVQEEKENAENRQETDIDDFKVNINEVISTPESDSDSVSDEDETGDVTEIGDDVFKDISDALATQINNEIKKQKRKKHSTGPKWWLFTLIPFIGIFFLFIGPIRRKMPKWIMFLRVAVFLAFTVCALMIFFQIVDEGLQEAANNGEMSIHVDWDIIKNHVYKFIYRK